MDFIRFHPRIVPLKFGMKPQSVDQMGLSFSVRWVYPPLLSPWRIHECGRGPKKPSLRPHAVEALHRMIAPARRTLVCHLPAAYYRIQLLQGPAPGSDSSSFVIASQGETEISPGHICHFDIRGRVLFNLLRTTA